MPYTGSHKSGREQAERALPGIGDGGPATEQADGRNSQPREQTGRRHVPKEVGDCSFVIAHDLLRIR